MASKPHVLFIFEKWHDADPAQGPNPAWRLWASPLENTGLATQEGFCFDEYYHKHHQRADAALLDLCRTRRPDLIFLAWIPPSLGGKGTPLLETLATIKTELKIPIVAVHTESIWPEPLAWAEQLEPYVAFNVIQSHHQWVGKVRDPRRYVSLWGVMDSTIFYNPRLPRTIDVSFMGAVVERERHPDRWEAFETLKAANINLHRGGGIRQENVPLADYARILMYSKISLNFPASGPYVECKGRAFELALCGALMVEPYNIETPHWFIPDVDYVPYFSSQDLVDKVRYYLAHDTQREEITERAYRKMMTVYSETSYWKYVLGRALEGHP